MMVRDCPTACAHCRRAMRVLALGLCRRCYRLYRREGNPAKVVPGLRCVDRVVVEVVRALLEHEAGGWHTSREAAALIGVSPHRVSRYCAQGRFGPVAETVLTTREDGGREWCIRAI